jgi:hypothetical protein
VDRGESGRTGTPARAVPSSAPGLSGTTAAAGALFAFAALGMFAGDVTTGRLLPPRVRARLGIPFLLLLAAPYLFSVLRPGAAVAAVLVAVAPIGFGPSLIQQERLVALIPDELSGHALGPHTAGMLTMQGVSAALAGGTVQLASPSTAMTVTAAASIAMTLTLAPRCSATVQRPTEEQRPEPSAPRARQSEVNSP